MKAALIVIDAQNEFVEDPRLAPARDTVLTSIAEALNCFRKLQLPVIHLHYITEPDGRGLLPHHRKEDRPRCLRGTTGAAPAEEARPLPGESVFAKQAYSGFAAPEFEEHLKHEKRDTLILCGMHTHACVRQTALDALQRDYQVLIISDAISSYDPLHAEISRNFLHERGAAFVTSFALADCLDSDNQGKRHWPPAGLTHPVACVDGQWIKRTEERTTELRNPSQWDEVLGHVPETSAPTVAEAVSAACRAQQAWQAESPDSRLEMINGWIRLLEKRKKDLLPWIIKEVGKPLNACRGEMDLLQKSIRVLNQTVHEEALEKMCVETENQVARARRRPLGIVAILAPWNNPVFLPASKIAAALVTGNAIVWKPALPCAKTSTLLQDSIHEAGIPQGLVNLVCGGAETARHLIHHPKTNAVTLTGSVNTGRQVGALCGFLLKPLQAELGGNNAAIVTRHCDLEAVADAIGISAFGYAGQACTATRRVILLESIEETFLRYLRGAVEKLVVGLPESADTVVGPVISRSHQRYVDALVSRAGPSARITAFPVPDGLKDRGCWLPPRIVEGLGPEAELVQTETFAPLLVTQSAKDLTHAINLCNAVPHGLISALFSDREQDQQRFREAAETGVIQLNLPTRNLHMESPFGGWKASGLGPPEHGTWDLDFYTRWQAVNERR